MLLTLAFAMAAEGMWLPEQLPEVAPEFADRGLEISPETLADPMKAPLGAVASLGFCTAAFVSPDGLLATNHHCVEYWLRNISTEENNYFLDGFASASREEEASVGADGRLWIVTSVDDVTEQMMQGIGRRTKDAARYNRLQANQKELINACEVDDVTRCRVASFYSGAEYRLITSTEIRDLRLVFAPPMQVGQFGGETDNWMWPRHSADFSFFRAYVAPDGSSATYSEENVPFKPKHFLEVEPEGAQPGEFVMVAGYPGRTSRHARAAVLAYEVEIGMAKRNALRKEAIDLLTEYAQKSSLNQSRLGPTISGLANGYKNTAGILEGMQRGDLVSVKQAQEAEFLEWVAADKKRARKLNPIISEYDAFLEERRARGTRDLYMGWIRGADMLSVASSLVRMSVEREKPEAERDRGYQERDLPRRIQGLKVMHERTVLEADEALWRVMLNHYTDLPESDRSPEFEAWVAEQSTDDLATYLYANQELMDPDVRMALFEASEAELRKSENPWIQLAWVFEEARQAKKMENEARAGKARRLGQAWMRAQLDYAASQNRPMYADANSTLRVTLGVVEGYSPQDGLVATPYTHMSGLAAKIGEGDFAYPEDYTEPARAADPKGIVNFLTTLDITGGNSGSSVLNGQGKLVGLLFDGVWESIPGDWVYYAPLNRSTGVDIRFMRWVMEQNPNTQYLRDELFR